MANNDYLRQTLEHYRQQKQAQLEDLRKTEALILHFEKELGEASGTESGEAVPLDYGNVGELRSSPPRAVAIEPDDFFGMTQTQAAKAYLLRVKKAVSIDQIVDALQRGGANLGGVDPKKTLSVSLARNPLREFVSPREGYFGLREFYPNLPKAVSKLKHKKKKKKKKKRAIENAAPRKVDDTSEKPVKTAVRQALGGGRNLSLEEIVTFVEKQLGRKVATFGIRATLRGKDFTKEGDAYRLAAH